jgi:hypothetical protein
MLITAITYLAYALCFSVQADTKKLSDLDAPTLVQQGKEWRINGNYSKALSCFRAAYAQDQELYEALLELSFAHLACEHFNKGFELIDTYFKTVSPLERQWSGQSLEGKTVLVHTPPWGYGDLFMFLRFIPQLRIHGASSILITTFAPIVQFLYENHMIDACVSCVDFQDYGSYSLVVPAVHRDQLPAFDYEVHLWSLPHILHITTAKKIPVTPYLKAAGDRSSYWRSTLAQQTGIKVGICWQGAQRPDPQMKLRALPHDFLLPLFAQKNIHFYCLHPIERSAQFNRFESVTVPDLCYDRLRGSFIDTAALINELDAVVTIDTAIAHLAGALGKRVFILLPYAADWRYHQDRTDSPWYPTATLIRQPTPGDWHSVIEKLSLELELLVTSSQKY